MAKYKIIALSCHSDRTQKIYNSQEIVEGSEFHEHQISELIKNGFIAPVKDEAKEDATTDPTGKKTKQ